MVDNAIQNLWIIENEGLGVLFRRVGCGWEKVGC